MDELAAALAVLTATFAGMAWRYRWEREEARDERDAARRAARDWMTRAADMEADNHALLLERARLEDRFEAERARLARIRRYLRVNMPWVYAEHYPEGEGTDE